MIDVIKNALEFLLLSVWSEEATILKEHITLAENHCIKVIVDISLKISNSISVNLE